MYALSLGVQRINEILPVPVYALLSGLNASTVGIIALAAVQLAEKAIKDKLTRILVVFGACAGLCYNALWYFPLLMFIGGVATVMWDGWLSQRVGMVKTRLQRRKRTSRGITEETGAVESVVLEEIEGVQSGLTRRTAANTVATNPNSSKEILPQTNPTSTVAQSGSTRNSPDHTVPISIGILIVILFFGRQFIMSMLARGSVTYP